MLTRHAIETSLYSLQVEKESGYKRDAAGTVAFEKNILNSHIAALDEIDRLKEECEHYKKQAAKNALELSLVIKCPDGYIQQTAFSKAERGEEK